LEIRPWARGCDAGLADLGIQAEIADELARIVETPNVADGGDEGRGRHQAAAGDRDQPLDRR
jgi:hypothetical protein